MQNKQTIYLVGGLPGMGKTSRILPGMSTKKGNLIPFLTDGIRFAIRNVIVGEKSYGKNIGAISFDGTATFNLPNDAREQVMQVSMTNKGEDQLAWIATRNLIKYYVYNLQQDLLVDGVAFTPQEVRNLELELKKPEIKIKAAFIGYSKKARDTRLNKSNYNDYDKIDRSNKFKTQVDDLKLPNYEYFDLIKSVPPERRNKDIVPLDQSDFDRNAEIVIKYLIED